MSMLPLSVKFYRSESGREPVREWLKALGRPDSAIIGECIGVVQRGWPIGMPVCRPMGNGLYEVRADLPGNRIARVLFCFVGNMIILLHSFIKKTQKTPDTELKIARERQSKCQAKKGNAT